MSRNIGIVDRWARVLLGIALLTTVVVGPQSLWGLIGLIPLTTGIVSFCPLYSVMGWSTSAPRPARAGR
jgi:Inner membrane protein YgaP-like, transmembrane domain